MGNMSIADLYRAGANPIGTVDKPNGTGQAGKLDKLSGPSEFSKVLVDEKAKTNFHLSQHAETRIKSREIPWSKELENRINSGINQAESKGSREALILADNVAVIANVKSRTIVTAMDRGQMKDRIFTNIDSAVLV